MRAAVGILLCLGMALWAVAAGADTYYKYRDKRTGRDVFVNRLEQVPRQYRDQAKIVLETGDNPAEPDKDPAPAVNIPDPPATAKPVPRPTPADNLQQNLRKALSSQNPMRDGPAAASLLIDLRLAAAGARPLANTERDDFIRLVVTLVIASIIASLAALVAWIVIIVTAVRDDRFWWALFIFIFSPLGYLYVFIHGGQGRALFKSLCTLGMLAPLLVGLVGAWRFYAWFQAVMQARGLHI